jgi:hypothetical protein
MNTAVCMVIGFEELFHKLYKTYLCSEFFDEEQPSIRREISTVKI